MTPGTFWLAIVSAVVAAPAVGHAIARLARPCCDCYLNSARKVEVMAGMRTRDYYIFFACRRHARFIDGGAEQGTYFSTKA